VSPTNKLISEMRHHAGLWSRDVGKAESHEREILVRAYELCLWAEEDRNNDMIVKGLIVAAGIPSSTRKSHKCLSGSGRNGRNRGHERATYGLHRQLTMNPRPRSE
jgi:hypothetical protein